MTLRRIISAIPFVLVFAVGCRGDDEPSCDDMEHEVRDLIESNQSCTMNADCVAGPALECFTGCGYIVNRSAREDVRARGGELVDEFKDRGCACSMPACAEEVPSHFECVQNTCTSVPNDI
jgi:hypothetical protein